MRLALRWRQRSCRLSGDVNGDDGRSPGQRVEHVPVSIDHGRDLRWRGSVSVACPQARGYLIRTAGQVDQHAAPVSNLEREFRSGCHAES
jgi:hypothetical protein